MENRNWRAYRNEEFQEEDVWAVIKDDCKPGFKNGGSNGDPSTPRSISRRLPSAARMIHGAPKYEHIDKNESKVVQSSAPVKIPDWSKIYQKTPLEKSNGSCVDRNENDYNRLQDGAGSDKENADYDDDGYDDDENEDGRLPPHEWLAKKLSRNQISSFSVCEGVGRTLKGRDLSRVRNAVLSRTGFL